MIYFDIFKLHYNALKTIHTNVLSDIDSVKEEKDDERLNNLRQFDRELQQLMQLVVHNSMIEAKFTTVPADNNVNLEGVK